MKHELTAKRLKTALDALSMRPQELADKSGVSKASISQYINGSHSPSNLSSGKMSEILNINPLWLMGFDVPMERTNNVLPSVSEMAKPPQIIGYYNSLNSTGQKEATKRVKELTYLPEYALKINHNEPEHLIPNAAHADDYDSAPDELKQLEENIMDDDNF